MTDVNVRALVTHARESGNRVDDAEAQLILDSIMEDGVSPAEYAQVEALYTDAAKAARGTGWAAALGLSAAFQMRNDGDAAGADAMLAATKLSLDDANEFRAFTEKLFNDIDAEFNKPLNRAARFVTSVWNSVTGD